MKFSVCSKTKKITNIITGQVSTSQLANSEISILKLLVSNKKPLSREYIALEAWERPVGENSLNVAINNLRRGFKEIGVRDLIVTIRGFGYELNENIEEVEVYFDNLEYQCPNSDPGFSCDKESCEHYQFHNKFTSLQNKVSRWKSLFYILIYASMAYLLIHGFFLVY